MRIVNSSTPFLASSIGLLLALSSLSTTLTQEVASAPINQWRSDLKAKQVEVRRDAALELLRAEPAARKELLPSMIAQLREDTDGQVRLALMDTLRDMGSEAEAAIGVLVLAMRKDFGGRYNEEIHQDYRAALALSAIGKAAVPELRSLLSSEEETNVRAESAMALGRIGADAKPAAEDLIGLLADEEPRLQKEARVALGKLADEVMEELIEATESEDVVVRAGVIEAIGCSQEMPGAAVKAVIAGTQDDDPEVKASSIRALRNMPIASAQKGKLLSEAVSDSNRQVRLAVVNLVVDDQGLIRGMQRALTKNLQSKDKEIAWHSAFLLQTLGAEGAHVLLQAAPNKESYVDQIGKALALVGPDITEELIGALGNSHPSVRQAAAYALGDIRPSGKSTKAALVQTLRDEDSTVQVACLTALGRIRSATPETLVAIQRLLTHESPKVRYAAVDAFSQLAARDNNLIEVVTHAVADDAPDVQKRSLEILTTLGPVGRRALPAVILQLQNKDHGIREAALTMIGSLGGSARKALPALVEMLEDPDWKLRVLRTIGELGSAAQPAVGRLKDLQSDSSAEIRGAALATIGELGLEPEELVPIVRTGLRDTAADVRGRAIRIVRQLGERSTLLLPILIPMVLNEDDTRGVEFTLKRMQRYVVPESLVSQLSQLIDHDSDRVRLLAIRFLGLAGPAASVVIPKIESLLESEQEPIRKEAHAALEKIRG